MPAKPKPAEVLAPEDAAWSLALIERYRAWKRERGEACP